MSMQMVELHYTTPPQYDPAALAARANELTDSGIEMLTPDSDSGTYLLVHKKQVIETKDGEIAAQTAVLSTGKATDPTSRCAILITEMLADGMEPSDRIRLFHGVLQAFIEITQPNAIAFMHSQQIVAPLAYLDSCTKDPIERIGSLNVRFFSVSNSENKDMLMDTRGLDEIGLHDLQVHFRELDPNDVSKLLFSTALYIFENGAVVDTGQTVAGTVPDSEWGCQFEKSLVDPNREILDLNPGPPYAAGGR